MKNYSNQQYLEMLKKLVEEQYSDLSEGALESYIDPQQIIMERKVERIKNNMNNNSSQICDVTNCKRKDIEKKVANCRNFVVGNFSIRVSQVQNSGIVDIDIYENKISTNFAVPSQIQHKLDILKDTRFKTCSWAKYFNHFKRGSNIPQETLVEIIKWLQVASSIGTFL